MTKCVLFTDEAHKTLQEIRFELTLSGYKSIFTEKEIGYIEEMMGHPLRLIYRDIVEAGLLLLLMRME